MRKFSFKDRLALCTNPTSQKLFETLDKKRSNLAFAADFTSSEKLLHFAEMLGPEICILKTHIDILEDFTPDVRTSLVRIAKKHHFLLFEDRKFADIGNTVSSQYSKGIYKIVEWADLINAHVMPGPGVIVGLKQVGLPLGRGLLLLAEMSSEGSLSHKAYTEHAVEMALQFSDFVIGFISQKKLLSDPRFIFLTPGIHLQSSQDSLGQRYRTPQSAMASGTDIIIVGRAIFDAKDPKHEASIYRQAGWDAYVASTQA